MDTNFEIIGLTGNYIEEKEVIWCNADNNMSRDRTLGNFETRIDTETQTRRALPAGDTSPRSPCCLMWSIWILSCRWQWSSWCRLQLWSRGWTGQPWRRRRRPPGAASRRRSRRADTCQEGRASSQLGRLFTRSSRRSPPMALSPEGQQAQGRALDQWAVPGKAQAPDRARAQEGGQDLGWLTMTRIVRGHW